MKSLPKFRTGRSIPNWAIRAATCVCGASMVGAQDAVPAENPPTLEEIVKTEADYRNWFDVSVGGNFINGDKARFMERHGVPKGAYGGVSDFHYEQDIGAKGLFEVDGRGIFDNNDYSLRLNLENPDYGYVRGGYSEFRTWYDGSGGYLPASDTFLRLYDEELFVDRGDFWLEGGLTLPGKPIFTFRYDHQFRDGKKDSTIWGDVGPRGVAPSFLDIDEERDIFQLDAEHTLAETRFGVGLRYENSEINDSRNMRRRPNEPQDRHLIQREIVESDLFNVHAFQETWFTDTLLFTTGYSFTTMDTDVGGSRIYAADYDALYDPLFARRQQRDEGFFNLSGGTKLDQHVMNLNLMFNPWEDFTIVTSLRAERQDQSGVATFEETNVGAGPNFTSVSDELVNTRERGFTDVSEGLSLRYTGFTNWVLYTRGEWLQGEGDLNEREIAAETGDVDSFRDTDSTRFTQKYVVGANWYPLRRLNFAAQYYHKRRANEYDHVRDSTANLPPSGNRYPAFIRDQDFTTDDINFRVTARPFATVSLVSRYDFQISTVDSRMDGLSAVESADIKSHIFGQSITWTPLNRLFLQGSVNYVIDRTETPAVGLVPDQDLVQRSDNDYIDASVTAGYALTDKTDLQAQYFVYYADNFHDNSAVSVPYEASAEEHVITATLIHRISSAMQWTLKYGWFTLSDKTYGGRNDYEAHMVYSSYRFRF
jgi:hypothetical protein